MSELISLALIWFIRKDFMGGEISFISFVAPSLQSNYFYI